MPIDLSILSLFDYNPCGPSTKAGVYMVCVFEDFPFKKEEKVLYIGSSKNINKRVMSMSHPYRKCYNKAKDGDIVAIKYHECDNYLEIEKFLIGELNPILNKDWKSDKVWQVI
jgi:excinuclease UvrABC nuclease subunit